MGKTQGIIDESVFSQRARQVLTTFPKQTSVRTEGMINLASGTPDFPTPPHIVEAGRRALADGHTQYTLWPGIPSLRQAIAEKLAVENRLTVDPEKEIIVTAGAQAAMLAVMLAVVDPGDEVIVPTPFYEEYSRDVLLAGGVVVPVPTDEGNSFEVDPAKLEGAITPKSKVIVLISPCNPTGGVIRPRTLEEIAKIVVRHDLLVIHDELYERYLYDNHKHVSIAALPGMRDRTVSINGFSKCYSMTGFRVGYVVAQPEIVRAVLPIHHGMAICSPAASQWAALAAVQGPHDWFEEVLVEYDKRRHMWMDALNGMGLSYGYPQGAFLIMINVTSTGLTSQQFAEVMAREAEIVVGGGGGPTDELNEGYARASLAVPMPELREGLDRMAPVVARYR